MTEKMIFNEYLKTYIDTLTNKPCCYFNIGKTNKKFEPIYLFNDCNTKNKGLDNLKELIKEIILIEPNLEYLSIYNRIRQKYFNEYPKTSGLLNLAKFQNDYVIPYVNILEKECAVKIDKQKEINITIKYLHDSYLLHEKWFNYDLQILLTKKEKDTQIIILPENLKELLSIWHDKNDTVNLLKIYNKHESIFTNSTKKLISCFAYELYDKKWLTKFKSETFNATDIAKIFLSLANLRFNPNYKSDFDFLGEKHIFNIKYSKKIKIDMNKIE